MNYFECKRCRESANALNGLNGLNGLDGARSSTHSSERRQSRSGSVSMRHGMGWLNEDTFFNEYSFEAAQRAAGAAIGLVDRIASNRCQVELCSTLKRPQSFEMKPLWPWQNGLALIRPPGHHCDGSQAMGFCLFNNVAVAVRAAQRKGLCQRILIVDWDVHHGNGLQNAFYGDDNVLYFSVHRFGDGFYPETGAIADHGDGFNVNVPLQKIRGRTRSRSGGGGRGRARFGDAAYLDIWKCILLPIAGEFDPELIVVAAGFDGCILDPINEDVMAISPPCYGVLCRMLMALCPKIAVILEGGYELKTMSAAIGYVTWSLLRGPLAEGQTLDLDQYTQSELALYVENTMWYKSVFFESEFRRHVLSQLDPERAASFEALYRCNAEYDDEQREDVTKTERRRVMESVMRQHVKRWKSLQLILDCFKRLET